MQGHRRVEVSRPLRDRTADSLRSLAVAPASRMLAGDPIGNFVAPTLIPVLAWLGVYLIDERLRALLPVRR